MRMLRRTVYCLMERRLDQLCNINVDHIVRSNIRTLSRQKSWCMLLRVLGQHFYMGDSRKRVTRTMDYSIVSYSYW